jgi:hypothetical protein
MPVINKRNAVFGWIAWTVVKQAAKQKVKRQAKADDGHGRAKLVAPAAIAAAVGGAVFLWRRLQNGDDEI